MLQIKEWHPTPRPLMYTGQIPHCIMPYEVNVLVSLVPEYGTSN